MITRITLCLFLGVFVVLGPPAHAEQEIPQPVTNAELEVALENLTAQTEAALEQIRAIARNPDIEDRTQMLRLQAQLNNIKGPMWAVEELVKDGLEGRTASGK